MGEVYATSPFSELELVISLAVLEHSSCRAASPSSQYKSQLFIWLFLTEVRVASLSSQAPKPVIYLAVLGEVREKKEKIDF